jgi:hypothetical protein
VVSAVALVWIAADGRPASAGGGPPYRFYFGELHAHTALSDGWRGTPEDAYIMARDAGANYMGTSDHNFMLTPDEWADTLRMADDQTDDAFVALPGSEYWIASGFGEIIVYNQDDLRNATNFHDPASPRSRLEAIEGFYDWLAAFPGAIGMWPHPGLYGDQDDFDHHNAWRDRAMSLIEIHNYGSWIGAPANWGVHDYEPAYVTALDKGWHIMPAANSDTHNNDWIVGSPVRTVLLARSLTRADLFDAMRSNRGYATLDENLQVRYTLNGEVMGSTLVGSGGPYEAEIRIEDPDGVPADAITRVEVISDGGQVVASAPFDATTVVWKVAIESATARYFYVRVTTASDVSGGEGVTAWTAPVWTGR